MKLVVVGINHELLNAQKRADFHFRESDKLSFCSSLLEFQIEQSLILSTCNRSEVYCMADDSFDESKLVTFYLDYFHQQNQDVLCKSGDEALMYLLEVACGLRSMVLGEDQIIHQLKDAFSWSLEYQLSGKELNYILNTTFSFAKAIRTNYGMNENSLSVSYIAYQWLKPQIHTKMKAMICGSGEMSQLMLEYLKGYEIYLVNRTYSKVEKYLNEQVKYVAFDKRYDYIQDVDIIVSATSSPHPIFNLEKMTISKNMLMVDMAIPRDFDVELKNHPMVSLVDMDDLKAVSDLHLAKRKENVSAILEECKVKVEEMNQGLEDMKSDHVIRKMQSHYLDIYDETVELLNRKLDLSKREQFVMQKILRAQFLRLMREPLKMLKSKNENTRAQYIMLLSEMLDSKEEN